MIRSLRTSPWGIVVACAALAVVSSAQAPARPQPTCIQNVMLSSAEGEDEASAARATVILRDGRIEAVLAADAPVPPGMRLVDGEGLLCLPAFLDAYTQSGHETAEPVVDQDKPVDVGAGVRVDMRLANRKGIQPAFRAVDALAIEASDADGWREAGFGAALVAPDGQLLSGTSCLATTREAAMRDVVVRPEVFAHAAFEASGSGYPSTLMGYMAQLRQFFLDASHHRAMSQRYEDGRPGPRPPFDAELEAGTRILAGERALLCEAETHRDVRRWMKLADELGIERIAIAGGAQAWRVAEELAGREIPVILTLDWGKQVDDPRPDEDEPEEAGAETEEAVSEEDAPAAQADEPAVDEGQGEAEESASEGTEEEAEPETDWAYTEPLGVRVERRVEWEEKRDGALVLHAAGVPFAFGTAGAKPDKLLEKVRTLVDEGLPAETAMAALTTTPAELLGVGERLGRLASGFDATLVLWSADPLTDEDAQPVWVFVDGFPTQYDPPDPEDETSGEGPAEGVDATGSWTLEVESDEGTRTTVLVLEMAEDGSVTGEQTSENPMDESEMVTSISGQVSGKDLLLDGTLELGDFQMEFEYELEIEGDTLSGEATYSAEFFSEPMVRSAEGKRDPGTHRSSSAR